MRLTAIALALFGAAPVLVAQGLPAPPEVAAKAPLVLEIGVLQYAASNRTAAFAGDSATTGKFERYVWADTSLCGLTSSHSEPTTVPGVGWHFTGELLGSLRPGQNAAGGVNQVVVNVEWQRLWENGIRLQKGPSGSRNIALNEGARLELDRVLPVGQSPCGAVDARLEAAVRAGGGSAEPISAKHRLQGAPTVIVVPAAYDAELWLVHRKPDGTEAVRQQTIRFSGVKKDYNFPSVEVATARGTITLDITGDLQMSLGGLPQNWPPSLSSPTGRAFFFFNAAEGSGSPPALRIMLSISRRVHAAGPPLLDITGGSTMLLDVPAPADVLSFEFPALQKATEDLLKGHQFSLRMRLTPVAK